MNRTLHSLINRRATRTGEVHYVHFLIDGDQAVVAINDCAWTRTEKMTRNEARAAYAEWKARGFVPFDNYGGRDDAYVIRGIDWQVAQVAQFAGR